MATPLRHRIETAVRPRVPVAALPRLVDARVRRARSDPRAVAEARRHMQFLVGARDPQANLDELADRYLHLMKWRGELRWHPELLTRQRVEGIDHLREARDAGRGAIVSFMHHGLYDGLFGSLAREDVLCTAVANPDMFKDTAPPWLRQQLAMATIDAPAISAAVGSKGLVAALREGALLGIASDWASNTPMTFMGRRVVGASGAARAAWETGSPVVLATSHRDDENNKRWPTSRIRLSAPLDPATFDSPQALLGAMVERHEQAVAEWPEAYDQPLKCWRLVDELSDAPQGG